MRRRILFTLVAMVSVAVVALFVPAALTVRDHVERGELLALQREASVVAGNLPETGPIDVTALTRRAQSHGIGLYDRTGALVDGTGPATADAIVADAARGVVSEGYVDGDLVAALPVRVGADGPEFVVRVTEPGAESDAAVRRDLVLLAAVAAAIIAAATVVGVLLARHLSRPVEQLREWTESLGHGDAAPPPPTTIDELAALGSALVVADSRIRQLLERERSFSSHVAHQLRTPVAAMRVTVEAELDTPRDDRVAVLLECLGALDRLESTISSMLALARHRQPQRIDCDVHAAVASQVDLWLPRFAAAGRSLHCAGRPVPAKIDRTVLVHVVDVLLDNALVHGSGIVEVRTTADADVVHVDVDDEGWGADGPDPFGAGRSDSGHGIGLRLARTLAESEGGTLELVATRPTRLRLTLPRQPAADAGRLPGVNPALRVP